MKFLLDACKEITQKHFVCHQRPHVLQAIWVNPERMPAFFQCLLFRLTTQNKDRRFGFIFYLHIYCYYNLVCTFFFRERETHTHTCIYTHYSPRSEHCTTFRWHWHPNGHKEPWSVGITAEPSSSSLIITVRPPASSSMPKSQKPLCSKGSAIEREAQLNTLSSGRREEKQGNITETLTEHKHTCLDLQEKIWYRQKSKWKKMCYQTEQISSLYCYLHFFLHL